MSSDLEFSQRHAQAAEDLLRVAVVRAETAEARCALLEEALGTCRQSAHTATDKALRKVVLEVTDAALSDTAQDDIYCGVCGAHVSVDADGACGHPPGCALPIDAAKEGE